MSSPDGNEVSAVRGVLRRADKVMSDGEVDAFLGGAFCGRIATVGADGYPYVVPNLFVWMEGCIFLHTAAVEGHFLRNVRHADRVSFEVDEPGEVFPYGPSECDTSISYRSVIAFGSIRIVSDDAVKRRFYSAFLRKYAPPESWGRERDSFPKLDRTIVYAVAPEAMTGKQGHLPDIDRRWRLPTSGA